LPKFCQRRVIGTQSIAMKRFAIVLVLAGTAPSLAEVSAGDGSLKEAASSSMTHCVHKCETYNECGKSLDNLSCETGCVAQCKCLSVKRRMLNAHKKSCMSMLQAHRRELAQKFHKSHQTGLLQTGKKGQEPSFREFVSVSDAFGPEEKPQPVKPHMLNAHHRRQAQVSFMAARKRALKRRHRAAMRQRRPSRETATKAGMAKGLAEVVSGIDGAEAAKKKAQPPLAKAADVKEAAKSVPAKEVPQKPAPVSAKAADAKKVPEKPAAKPAETKATLKPATQEAKPAAKKPVSAKATQDHKHSFIQIENAD